jgi:hypothetical protein
MSSATLVVVKGRRRGEFQLFLDAHLDSDG